MACSPKQMVKMSNTWRMWTGENSIKITTTSDVSRNGERQEERTHVALFKLGGVIPTIQGLEEEGSPGRLGHFSSCSSMPFISPALTSKST